MTTNGDIVRENATLTEADLAACKPLRGEDGGVLRAFCPFHGSAGATNSSASLQAGGFLLTGVASRGRCGLQALRGRGLGRQPSVYQRAHARSSRSSCPHSRPRCLAAAARHICASGAFP